MVRFLPHVVARPLIALWLTSSAHSWRRRVTVDDSPHVHARGMDPDRVLLAGGGAAADRGVRTHELGLPGFLARSLSVHTGRATDVDVVDRLVRDLDEAAEEIMESGPRVSIIAMAPGHPLEREGSHLYRQWADGISRRISAALDPARSPGGGERVLRDEAQEHPWGMPALVAAVPAIPSL